MRKYLWHRELTCLLCAAVAVLVVGIAHPPVSVDGYLLDLMIEARAVQFPARDASDSPVAVVAIDGRSLDSPELADYPRVFLAPVWAHLLDVLFAAGARDVGFDEILAYNPDRLPNFNANFNQPFLAALHKFRGQVVLARSADQVPALPFTMAAGADSLALAEIPADPDGLYRHVPSEHRTDQGVVPSLAGLLVQRARVPMSMPPEVLIAPRRHLETIPTYALVDVLRCAGSPEALKQAFNGKIVLIGGTLPEEDRKKSSDRLLTAVTHDSAPVSACGLKRLGASSPTSRTIPGVFVHAAAIEAVVQCRLTSTASPTVVAAIAAVAAAVGAATAMLFMPWIALGVVAAFGAIIFFGATLALQNDLWIPVALPLVSLGATPVIGYAVRYLIEERTRRRVERAFDHYLSPAIVSRLASDPSALKLGGEEREVTVMFADLSGFTALSTTVSATELTSKVNRYLGYVVDEVEATGGYVDKFIGDAVMAMWGAPVPDPNHAIKAVRAARAAVEKIQRARAEDEARGERGFSIKIGINSGTAIVGNVGTTKRYNYTAVGETVNLASRLEGVPPLYQCHIVVGPQTARLAASEFVMRELDRILVKGASAPMAIFHPIAIRAQATGSQLDRERLFAKALDEYRAMRFAQAGEIWETLAALEEPASSPTNGKQKPVGPAAAMAEQARQFAAHPPAQSWDGVRVLVNK
jgi:adenylate cyclase